MTYIQGLQPVNQSIGCRDQLTGLFNDNQSTALRVSHKRTC